jgi:hypothetical protein
MAEQGSSNFGLNRNINQYVYNCATLLIIPMDVKATYAKSLAQDI